LRIWRLARRLNAALDGEGARLYGGRWSAPGVPVVYTSATASLAALEYLVHLTMDQAPTDLILITIDVPPRWPVETVEIGDLPPDWRSYPAPEALALIGSAWAHELRTPILAVPSAVVPHESNYLLNPRHSDFGQVTTAAAEPFLFDARLRRPMGSKSR
jgi:RES domain-containing protein